MNPGSSTVTTVTPAAGDRSQHVGELPFGLSAALTAAALALLPVARASSLFFAYASTLALAGVAVGGLWFAEAISWRHRLPARALERWLYLAALATAPFGASLPSVQVGPFSLFPFRAFVILSGGLAGASLLAEAAASKSVRPRRHRWFIAFVLVWLGWGAATGLWVVDQLTYLRSLANLVVGVAFVLLTVRYAHDERRFSTAIAVWSTATAAIVGIALIEVATGVHLPASTYADAIDLRGRFVPTGVFRNPNDLATAVSLALPFLVALGLASKRILSTIAAAVCAAASLFVIVATSSRANLAAAGIAFVALAAMSLLRPLNRRLLLYAFTVLAGAAVAVAVSWHELGSLAATLAGSLQAQAGIASSSVSIRLNLARNAMVFLSRTAGLGVGLGNAEAWVALRSVYPTQGVLNLHNWWLEVLTELGVPFFVAYAAFYLSLAWRVGLAYLERLRAPASGVAATFAALVSFPLASISSSSVMSLAVHWILLGLAIASVTKPTAHPQGGGVPAR